MRRPAWADLVRSWLVQTRAGSHRFEWFLNWASAGLGCLSWISMNSGGMNRVSMGLASSDQASAGRRSCFCFECCSFPCCLLLSFGCVLLATLATRDLSFAVCCMSRFACVLCCALCVACGRTVRLFPTVLSRLPSSLRIRRNRVPISTFLAENCGCERF